MARRRTSADDRPAQRRDGTSAGYVGGGGSAVQALVDFNGTAFRVFGDDPATPAHLLMLNEHPGTDPG